MCDRVTTRRDVQKIPLAYGAGEDLCLLLMLTDVQDPTDRYAPFLEEVRRDGEARAPRYGIARLVHFLFLELVMHVLMLMVRMAKRAQEGKLPEVAPVAGKEASPPVVGVQPRCERFEQPEVGEPIAEAPCEMPVVEQTAGLAPARPWHAENDRWPPWHELGIVWTLEVGFWGDRSQKSVLEGADMCARFVTIEQ